MSKRTDVNGLGPVLALNFYCFSGVLRERYYELTDKLS